MADTRRTFAALAVLFADNTAGAISAQDLRDFLASMKMHTSSSAPTTSDDETSGFDVGHEWLETSTPAIYKCRDASTGSAVWEQTWPVTASGVEAAAVTYDNNVSGLTAEDVQAAIDELADESGDMLKSTYDANDNGKVDVAERVEETVSTDTDSTATHAIDCDTGTIHKVTLTANCTLSFTNVPSGGFGITLELIQDATGSRTVTWPSSVTWAGGTAPTLTTTASAVDVVTLYTPDGGTTWRGFLAGLAFS